MNTRDLIESQTSHSGDHQFDYDENEIFTKLRSSKFAVNARGGTPNADRIDLRAGHDFFPEGSVEVVEKSDHIGPILQVIYTVPEGLRYTNALSVLARATESSGLPQRFILGTPGEGKGGTEAFILLRDRDHSSGSYEVPTDPDRPRDYGSTTYRY